MNAKALNATKTTGNYHKLLGGLSVIETERNVHVRPISPYQIYDLTCRQLRLNLTSPCICQNVYVFMLHKHMPKQLQYLIDHVIMNNEDHEATPKMSYNFGQDNLVNELRNARWSHRIINLSDSLIRNKFWTEFLTLLKVISNGCLSMDILACHILLGVTIWFGGCRMGWCLLTRVGPWGNFKSEFDFPGELNPAVIDSTLSMRIANYNSVSIGRNSTRFDR